MAISARAIVTEGFKQKTDNSSDINNKSFSKTQKTNRTDFFTGRSNRDLQKTLGVHKLQPKKNTVSPSEAFSLQNNIGNKNSQKLLTPVTEPGSDVEFEKTKPETAVSKEPSKKKKAESIVTKPNKQKKGMMHKAAREKQGKKEGNEKKKGKEVKQKEEKEIRSSRQAIAPAVNAIGRRARDLKKINSPAEQVVKSAQLAGIEQKTEQTLQASATTVTNIDTASSQSPSGIESGGFKSKLKEAIKKAIPIPENAEKAEEVFETGHKNASGVIKGELGNQQSQVVGPLDSATTSEAEVLPESLSVPATPNLVAEQPGPGPKSVSSNSVVPSPMSAERLDYSENSQDTNTLLLENNITEDQLQRANDPDFSRALESKSAAQMNESSTITKYRKSEASIHGKTGNSATQLLESGIQFFYNSRSNHISQVAGKQLNTKDETAKEHQLITRIIEGIKNSTKKKVQDVLSDMETNATSMFEQGLQEAEKAYTDVFEDEKGSIFDTIADWFSSDWFSDDDEPKTRIDKAFEKGREAYDGRVSTLVDDVAIYVEGKLANAKRAVSDGKKEVETFVNSLDGSQKAFAEKARSDIMVEFEAMITDIDSREENLVNSITHIYTVSQERLNETEHRLREENKSLWDKAYEATVGVVEKINEFKNLLLSVLSSAADVVETIIDDPIGFLSNLIGGVKAGLEKFMGKIGEHLQKGFIDWLLGTFIKAGITIPETFDVKSVLKLVLDILGITYQKIRDKIAKVVGEERIAKLERMVSTGQKIAGYAEEGFRIFEILKNEGLAGLWEYIKEKIGNLKDMVLEQIKSWVQEKVLIGGLMWLISLLNPAAAFVKAVMGIYDLVMLFVDRFSQFKELADAVIGTLSSIAKGDVGIVANAVENTLARFIPVAIGIMASLLKIGGISDKIREVIKGLQGKVDLAIDWIIQKIVGMVKKIGEKPGFGKGEKTSDPRAVDKDLVLQEALEVSQLLLDKSGTIEEIELHLPDIKEKFGLKSIYLNENKGAYHIEIKVNPEGETREKKLVRAIDRYEKLRKEGLIIGDDKAVADFEKRLYSTKDDVKLSAIAEFIEFEREILEGRGPIAIRAPELGPDQENFEVKAKTGDFEGENAENTVQNFFNDALKKANDQFAKVSDKKNKKNKRIGDVRIQLFGFTKFKEKGKEVIIDRNLAERFVQKASKKGGRRTHIRSVWVVVFEDVLYKSSD